MDMTRRLHEGQLLLLPDTRNNEREKIKKKMNRLFISLDPEYQRALMKARPIAIPARVRSISWSSGYGYVSVSC